MSVINCQIQVDFWLSVSLDWVWDALEVLVVGSALQVVNHVFKFSGVIERSGSIWVKVTEVVEVLLSETLALSIAHFRLVERVVNDLKGFPVTLSLQYFVHLLLGASVALSHYVSVELDQPNLFQENFDVARRIVIDHLRNIFDCDA